MAPRKLVDAYDYVTRPIVPVALLYESRLCFHLRLAAFSHVSGLRGFRVVARNWLRDVELNHGRSAYETDGLPAPPTRETCC